jgi:ATP-dependent Clp protease ATP-binding subunit ClpA
MNTLSQAHYSAALSGAPPGYVGSKEGHTLFDAAQIAGDYSTPGIVLFDEVEKASPEVLRALLNVLEDGHLRLSAGEKSLDFRNTLLLMTSNLGGRQLSAWLKRSSWWPGRGGTDLPRRVQRQVHDRVLIYRPLGDTHTHSLLELELDRLNRRLNKKGWRLTLTAEAYEGLGKNALDNRYGARSVRRLVRDAVEAPLASFLLQAGAESTSPELCLAEGHWQSGQLIFLAR